MVAGQVVADRYELEELVGTGGMATVYRARDRVLERWVAIKILHERYADDDELLERFSREARAAAQLSHPNIVTVIDRGEDAGRPYIVFEYVDGETLKRVVDEQAPLPVRDAIELTLQIAGALAFAHSRGVVHRDVKPQNVLLTADGRAKVTDFGIARVLDVDAGVTQTGTVLGTSDYMAPEQAYGEPTSSRTDVYSLGAVLYELLTGAVVFPGETFVSVAMKHASEPPPSVLESRPDCPVRLAAAVDRCLAKDPDDRFPSMRELVDELDACLDELDARGDGDATLIIAPRKPARPAPERAPRRRRALPVAVLALGVPALAAAVAVLVLERNAIRDALPVIGTKSVALKAVATYDPIPPGDGTERADLAGRATDGDEQTYWETEDYNSPFQDFKPGVGLVLRSEHAERLTKLTVKTDTPGYDARVRAGPSPQGPFVFVSPWKTVGRSTALDVKTGHSYRYWVLWVRFDHAGSVHVNEVTARAR